ncbi:MAG: GntR family transcriptional regulator [Actinomycetota bacterium]
MADADRAMIGSEPLSTSIKRILLDRIVSGQLVPGERIVESRVAKELQISQSPVREALRDLAAIGLVDIESRRGARVRKPTAKELRDVSEVRAEIDALASRLAAERLTDETMDQLREAHREMTSCHAAGDYVGMTEADAEFHRIIAHASGNRAVERVFGQLEPFARTYITLTSPNVEVDGILRQHGGILDALVARDADLAADRARAHQLSVREAFFLGAEAVDADADG